MNRHPAPEDQPNQKDHVLSFVPVGAILTGGASRRFGSDKALALLPANRAGDQPAQEGQEGQEVTMGGSIVSELRLALTDPVVAVGGSAGHALGIPVIADPEPDLGPLAGLASVLRWAGRGFVVVVPCDAPRLRASHIRLLVEASWQQQLAVQTKGGTKIPPAVVALVGGKPQPTFGCWPAQAGMGLQRAVRRGERRMMAALDHVSWVGVEIEAAALSDADDPATLKALCEDFES